MFLHKGLSQFLLRLGVGITFIWIGIDVFRTPEAWIGFVPNINLFGFTQSNLLQFGGVFDIAIGLLLITGFFYRLAALLGALHLAYVVITFGVDQVLIRDVGLIGALLSLFFWKKNGYKRSWYKKLFKKKKPAYEEY